MTGFTLIEVLIALVIFSIGLLGLAGMQLRGSEGTNMAYFRSQATLIANDMAERLHANQGGAYTANAYSATGACTTAPTPFCATRSSTIGSSCTPAEMAAFDLYTLACSTKSLLPSAKITVVCNDYDAAYASHDTDPCTAGSPHTVTVSWNEVTEGKSQASDVTLVVLP